MDPINEKTVSLICPTCRGVMELSRDGKEAVCPYCGHRMLISKEDSAAKEYELRMAKARAEEDIRDLREKKQRKRRLRRWLIAFCVMAGLLLVNIFIPDSPMNRLVFPRTVDPFTCVDVKFQGISGEGRAELSVSDNGEEYADEDIFELVPDTALSNGDVVTVRAKAAPGWRFEPAEKQFTVSGLTAYVQSTDQLTGDNLTAIHSNTERLIREDWEEVVSSSLAQDMTYTPYKMYLFVADEDTSYERNVLYDTYEVNVTREDGTVFTAYEACWYADLRIPADGVMTASYGSLQGFNFGYNYGFSYAHSFAGWTDAAEMEADLRNVRDGYRLAD
jgi:DNA-directed RNA polymerase subunit RPC12/RpoP